MKRVIIFFLTFLCLFSLTGCTGEKKEEDSDTPANLKEITGEIREVELDDNGDIIINKEEVTEEVGYYSYKYEGVIIGLLAVRDSKGNVRVVVNTCQSCGGSPYAYFVQVGDKIQCQNCGNMFEIDSLGELEETGCNPIAIENKEETSKSMKISHIELEQYKEKFENWKGPKK